MARIAIFGATSAIATSCARLWLSEGSSLFLVARNPDKLQVLVDDLCVRKGPAQVLAQACADLNDFERHEDLLAEARRALGGLDVLLVAHGSLPDQRVCELSVNATLDELRTNALSIISLVTLAANLFQTAGHGTIAVISSVAGDRGRQSNYVYGTAKGAVSLFLEGVRNRLSRSGVRVVTIKPGFVDTPMTAHLEKKGPLWAQPQTIARGIARAVNGRRDVVYLPGFWRWIMVIIRHIPEPIFKRMSL
ncbi:MAG: SDR family oxidoreductase [Acetobacteraceae bacterium]|jgi:decaprenylphospho-beta-D-erythro-pentofuranosid-2-ulose 2-reductase